MYIPPPSSTNYTSSTVHTSLSTATTSSSSISSSQSSFSPTGKSTAQTSVPPSTTTATPTPTPTPFDGGSGGYFQRWRLIFVLLCELDTDDSCKLFYLKSFLYCLYLVNPTLRADFIHAFTLLFADQVDSSIECEKHCNAGKLSQLIINTRFSHGKSDAGNRRYSSSNSESALFVYHRQIDYLLEFCSRFFIRPFPASLLNAILGLFRTSIILVCFVFFLNQLDVWWIYVNFY